MDFIDNVKATLNEEFNVSVTENMALGYKTTGKKLLDLNFAVASLRDKSEQEILDMFLKAYFEDRKAALVWLFYARDVRGGLGERRLFRVIFDYLAKNNDEVPIETLIGLVPIYGRYDDLFGLLDTQYSAEVIGHITRQIALDLNSAKNGESISLLAKWLPSVNASSEKTRKNGKMIAKKLGMSEKEYRQILSKLRNYIDIVERKMSSDRFSEIRYEAVPSKANLIYKNAFIRHDEERRKAYLESLKKGETKINAAVLYPHEIVHAYTMENAFSIKPYDETLEQLWKALPAVPELANTIVVADGSGSMGAPVGGTRCAALSVANALAIYFAERSAGQFKDKYITFSASPQLVDLSPGVSLKERLQIALAHNEVANTDIYSVFMLILQSAVSNSMKQEELPKNIVIISDMEFDYCADNVSKRLFHRISYDYNRHGFKLPRLVFWNVNARTNTIPIKENELGVALVSGFSISIAKMVMSQELEPYRCLLDILNDKRYDLVRSALNGGDS